MLIIIKHLFKWYYYDIVLLFFRERISKSILGFSHMVMETSG